MTLQEIIAKYTSMKENACRYHDWSQLDEFVEELAQLASGTPIVIAVDDPEEIFKGPRC